MLFGGFHQATRCLIKKTQVCITGSLLSRRSESLPDDLGLGSVYITIESSGVGRVGVSAAPDLLYTIALSICQECVLPSGRGGFATQNFISAVDWAADRWVEYQWRTIPPVATSFLTITISGPTRKLFTPGNYDPEIPAVIAKTIRMWEARPHESQLAPSSLRRVEFWEERSEQMQRGGTEAWWAIQPLDSSMEYQCDELLGSPVSADCAHIEWSQLNPSPDTINIGPGVLFLHFNTCFLAISAAVPLVITWNQVRVAMSALMDVCIQYPFQASQGGRAFLGHPSSTSISGRRRKRQSGLTGRSPSLDSTLVDHNVLME